MVYIVLPPELSSRAIQTLIQYMYSGEATVSIDILSEVLQGGEMLKIRGLWHNNRPDEPSACPTPHFMAAVSSQPVDCTTTNNNASRTSLSSTASSMASVVQSNGQLYDRRPPMDRLPVLKERPMNLMSPPHPPPMHKSIPPPPVHHHSPHSSGVLHIAANATVSNSSHSTQSHHPSNGHIIVKKEMAIDPGDGVPLANHFGHSNAQSHPIRTAASKKVHMSTEKRSKSLHENGRDTAALLMNDQQMISQRRASSPARYSTISRSFDEEHRPPRELETIDEHNHIGVECLATNGNLRRSSDEHLRPVTHRRLETPPKEPMPPSNRYGTVNKHIDGQVPEPMNFLTIKQEPTEWPDYDVELDKTHIEVVVKPELVYGDRGTDDEGKAHNIHVLYDTV